MKQTITDPTWSTDGKHLAFVAADANRLASVYLYDLEHDPTVLRVARRMTYRGSRAAEMSIDTGLSVTPWLDSSRFVIAESIPPEEIAMPGLSGMRTRTYMVTIAPGGDATVETLQRGWLPLLVCDRGRRVLLYDSTERLAVARWRETPEPENVVTLSTPIAETQTRGTAMAFVRDTCELIGLAYAGSQNNNPRAAPDYRLQFVSFPEGEAEPVMGEVVGKGPLYAFALSSDGTKILIETGKPGRSEWSDRKTAWIDLPSGRNGGKIEWHPIDVLSWSMR